MFSRFHSKISQEEQKRIMEHKIKPDSSLEARDINFYYGKRKIIDEFNYDFKKNRIYSILGASGSGKSTLAAHFNGLLKSNTANIYLFNGENIYKFKKKIDNFREIRKKVGMVLQNPEYQLFKETVLDDVCCGLEMLGFENTDIKRKGKDKLLELGISEEFFDRNPFLLSGGQKKKIALAGILVIEPTIIIFDEPILGLDPASSRQIIDIILELKQQGRTAIVISNNIDLLLELGDEILVLEKGRLVMHGNPYQIFRDPRIDLGTPKIISFIKNLCKYSSKFEELWKYQPKNIEELSEAISNVLRK